jgi:hypothetical protein
MKMTKIKLKKPVKDVLLEEVGTSVPAANLSTFNFGV